MLTISAQAQEQDGISEMDFEESDEGEESDEEDEERPVKKRKA